MISKDTFTKIIDYIQETRDCDCGRSSLINEVVDENGDYVDISSPDKLYDFLLHNIANRI